MPYYLMTNENESNVKFSNYWPGFYDYTELSLSAIW